MVKKIRKMIRNSILCASFFVGMTAPALASELLSVDLHGTQYINAEGTISRVVVGDPAVADVKAISSSELVVFGNGTGSTSLVIWTDDGMMQDFAVSVTANDATLAATIQAAIGLPDVHVTKVGDRIVLQGTVKNQVEKDTAERIAAMYCGKDGATESKETDTLKSAGSGGTDSGSSVSLEYNDVKYDKLVDLLAMTDPLQIDIEAQIIEMSSDDAANLGVQWSDSVGTTGVFHIGQDYTNSHSSRYPLLNRVNNINASVSLLLSQGKAKILSRPHISTLSGQHADISIGGRIPYLQVDKNGNTDTKLVDYGIKLLIEPTVDRNNNITSKIYAEISSLDWENAITVNSAKVPALKARDASAVISVPSGDTMAIGGLLNSQDAKTVKKVPLLSSIPIIGEFFKYSETTTDRQELVILITPRLVNAATPTAMSEHLKDFYEDGQRNADARKQVDVNQPMPPVDKNGKAAERLKPQPTPSAQLPSSATTAVPPATETAAPHVQMAKPVQRPTATEDANVSYAGENEEEMAEDDTADSES